MEDYWATRYWLELQLNVHTSAGDLGAIAFRWLDEVSLRLVPDARAEVADLPGRVARGAGRGGPLGEPGSLFGTVSVDRWVVGGGPTRSGERNASTAGMGWLREEMRELPRQSRLRFGRLDERGHRSGWLVSLTAERLPESPDWLRLSASLPEAEFMDPQRGPGVQRDYLEAVWPFADGLNPGFGHVGYSLEGATAFEYCLRNIDNPIPREWWNHRLTVNHCREFLRGYSWLTIVPGELADRLGGVPALAGSGAFAQVRPLAHGGVWLLATADYREFTDEALARVFRVVAPVLRPGPLTNWPRMAGKSPLRVIFQDAAEATAR